MSTGVHFHGIEVPFNMDGVPDITQAPIKPGQTFTYDFTANKPELGMYHSHHDAQVQVPNGMLGIFQIGDPALPPNTGPVTQTVPMVLNDAGVIGLSLNGKSFPATAPIIAHVGDWVEINYFNEGLQIHPMHLHGLPQLVIGEDGYPLASPYTRRHARGRARAAVHDARARDVRLPRAEQHARHLGLPLPHPHPRRRPQRHVRHGHDVHRRTEVAMVRASAAVGLAWLRGVRCVLRVRRSGRPRYRQQSTWARRSTSVAVSQPGASVRLRSR